MSKRIIYLDMDNVLVDFDGSKDIPDTEKHVYNHSALYSPGFFYRLPIMNGAKEFVNILLNHKAYFDVYILTQPMVDNAESYSDKVKWVRDNLPSLKDKIIMTQNKNIFHGHLLVDDNIKWKDFNGHFFHFDPKKPLEQWTLILEYLDYLEERYKVYGL